MGFARPGMSFREFALLCAFLSRGTPCMDEKNPHSMPHLKMSHDADEEFMEAHREAEEFLTLDFVSLKDKWQEEKASEEKSIREMVREHQDSKAHFEKLLEEARAFNPPSPEHVQLKQFMERDLLDSIAAERGTLIGLEQSLESLRSPKWAEFSCWMQWRADGLSRRRAAALDNRGREAAFFKEIKAWYSELWGALEGSETCGK